jgi:hypothetical protein
MLILRVGRKGRWEGRRHDNALDVAEAAKDLQLRAGEAGLSVFEVEDADDAGRIALLYALYRRTLSAGRRLDDVDYLLVPSDHFTRLGLTIRPVPDGRLFAPLSERHRGLGDRPRGQPPAGPVDPGGEGLPSPSAPRAVDPRESRRRRDPASLPRPEVVRSAARADRPDRGRGFG